MSRKSVLAFEHASPCTAPRLSGTMQGGRKDACALYALLLGLGEHVLGVGGNPSS